MLRETDLFRVKLVAHTLLDVQIQKTAFSPAIVSHPFTNSGISALRKEDGSLSMVDLDKGHLRRHMRHPFLNMYQAHAVVY